VDAVRVDPGVVHEHVDVTEAITHTVNETGYALPVPHVTSHRHDVRACLGPDLLGDLVAEILLPAADDDRCAGARHPPDHRPADPLRRTGDDRHLARQVEHVL